MEDPGTKSYQSGMCSLICVLIVEKVYETPETNIKSYSQTENISILPTGTFSSIIIGYAAFKLFL